MKEQNLGEQRDDDKRANIHFTDVLGEEGEERIGLKSYSKE